MITGRHHGAAVSGEEFSGTVDVLHRSFDGSGEVCVDYSRNERASIKVAYGALRDRSNLRSCITPVAGYGGYPDFS